MIANRLYTLSILTQTVIGILYVVTIAVTTHDCVHVHGFAIQNIPNQATQQVSSSSSSSSSIEGLSADQRQQLITKASEYPNSVYQGWSNRAGKVLTPIHIASQPCNNVYSADRQFKWFGIDVGGRCTVIELPSSSSSNQKPDLFIHSPVELDNVLKATLESIGTIKYVCSPNYEHLKYGPQWYETYKENGISCWGCPGLMAKKPEIGWDGEIPFNYRPVSWKYSNNEIITSDTTDCLISDKCWDTTILQPIHINIEKNPFTGQPFFEEVLFYHVPTKSLLTTDFFWNYPGSDGITNSQQGYDGSWELAPSIVPSSSDDDGTSTSSSSTSPIPLGSRIWKWAMDGIYSPFFHTLMISDRTEYNKICDHLLTTWDIETIIPCHGDIIRGKSNVQKALRDALRM